jgi:hypothetical protein
MDTPSLPDEEETSGPFLLTITQLLSSVRKSLDISETIINELPKKPSISDRQIFLQHALSPECPRTLSAVVSSTISHPPRTMYRQRLKGKWSTYSAIGSHLPDDLLDDLERVNLNSTAIDVVADKGWVAFEDAYCEVIAMWLQNFYDFWCRDLTQHEEDTCAIRAHGNFVDYVFEVEELHEILRSDLPDFYLSLKPRLPDDFGILFEKYLSWAEKKLEAMNATS